jgi:hypothetical protein
MKHILCYASVRIFHKPSSDLCVLHAGSLFSLLMTLKIYAMCPFETSVDFHCTTLRYVPGDMFLLIFNYEEEHSGLERTLLLNPVVCS